MNMQHAVLADRKWRHYLVAGETDGVASIKPGITTNLRQRLGTHRRAGLTRVVTVSSSMSRERAYSREAELLEVLDLFGVANLGQVAGAERRDPKGEALAVEYIDKDIDASPLLSLVRAKFPVGASTFDVSRQPVPWDLREAACRRIFGFATPVLTPDLCDSLQEAVARAMDPRGEEEAEVLQRRANGRAAQQRRNPILAEFGCDRDQMADEILRLRALLGDTATEEESR